MKPNRWFTPLGLLLFFLLCLVPSGQAQTCVPVSQGATPPWQLGTKCVFTAASSPAPIGNVSGLSYFQILFIPSGTVSGATLSLDSSATGSSYTTGGIIAAGSIGAMTSAGSYANSTAVTPTVFGQLTPTITGSGNVTVILFGYVNNPATSSGGGGNSTIISPLDGSNNVKVNCEVGCAGGSTTPSDSFANPSTAGLNFSLHGVFNGTTWERWRSAIVGNAVAGTGIGATAHYCEYLSSLPTLTNATYGAAQCDSSGRLLTNGAGVTQPTSDAADGTSGSTAPAKTVQVGGLNGGNVIALKTDTLGDVDVNLESAIPAGSNQIGGVTTQPAGFASAVAFQQAVTASAVALATNSTHGFCVQALGTNTISIYVGPSGVTTSTGFPLAPGVGVCYQLSNSNLIYVIASTTGASVAVTGD